jgi:hypothetical protein
MTQQPRNAPKRHTFSLSHRGDHGKTLDNKQFPEGEIRDRLADFFEDRLGNDHPTNWLVTVGRFFHKSEAGKDRIKLASITRIPDSGSDETYIEMRVAVEHKGWTLYVKPDPDQQDTPEEYRVTDRLFNLLQISQSEAQVTLANLPCEVRRLLLATKTLKPNRIVQMLEALIKADPTLEDAKDLPTPNPSKVVVMLQSFGILVTAGGLGDEVALSTWARERLVELHEEERSLRLGIEMQSALHEIQTPEGCQMLSHAATQIAHYMRMVAPLEQMLTEAEREMDLAREKVQLAKAALEQAELDLTSSEEVMCQLQDKLNLPEHVKTRQLIALLS